MSYTNKDLDNGINYSNNRYTLQIINSLYKKLPHLISHLEYSIEKADPNNDYYYPSTFEHRAIKVTTHIPSKLCEKISCNSVLAESACTRSNVASYYYIGDSNVTRRQCEPSCFNLLKDPVIDEETGEEQVQMLRLEYNATNGCIILPTAYIWHEHPFYRSENVYEHRLNDLPVGFNLDNLDPYSYSGLTYEYNKSYCDAFYDQWDGNKRTCIKKWWETVLYAVVGESIIKMVKAGVQTIQNGYKSDYPEVNLPELPDIEDVWTLKGWTEDINTSFVLPPIEYENTSMIKIQREITDKNDQRIDNEFEYLKRLNLVKQLKNKRKQISCNLRRKLEQNYDIKITEKERIEIDNVKKINKKYHCVKLINKLDESESSLMDILSSVIEGLLSVIFDPAFWIDIGIGISSDIILSQIKIIFRKLSNSIIPKLTKKILAYSGKVLSKVFTRSLFATIANTMSRIVIKTVSKVMIQLTKLIAELASVVGIILAIITIFDILLTIWDPLGFNNKFDEEIINSVTRSSDIAMRQSLEVAIPTMTFEIFTNMCLTAEEILDESLNTFQYIYEYLNALTVNSEGSRIDKGSEIDFNNVTNEDDINNQNIVNSKQITPKELYDYEYDHNQRMKYFITPNNVILGMLVVSILFMIIDIWFMAIICFILVILLISLSYFNSATINMGKLVNDTLALKSLII